MLRVRREDEDISVEFFTRRGGGRRDELLSAIVRVDLPTELDRGRIGQGGRECASLSDVSSHLYALSIMFIMRTD